MCRARQLGSATSLVLLGLCLTSLPRAAAETPAVGHGRAIDYTIQVRIDLTAGTYAGRETVRVANRSRDKFDHLFFNLYPNVGASTDDERLLDVTSVTIGEAAARFTEKGSGLRVDLDAPVVAGESVSVTIEFTGGAVRHEKQDIDLDSHVTDQVSIVLDARRERPRRGGDVASATEDSMLLGNPFPVLAMPRDEVWIRERTAGAYVFSDPAAYRIEVESADGVAVLASGREVAPGANGARVFEADAARSVAVFAARGFLAEDATGSGVRLRSLYSRGHQEMGKRAAKVLVSAVDTYSQTLGPAPFSEIALVEAPLAPGVTSVAFSGLIAVASAFYTDTHGEEWRALPGFIRDVPELVEGEVEFAVLRETARQWWSESVSWEPRRSSFLAEGLAYASASTALARLHGADAAAQSIDQRLRAPYRVYRMFGGRDMAAAEKPSKFQNYFAYSAIVQTKGGLFLEALRGRLGDDNFLDYLGTFYREHAKASTSTPQDFLSGIEQGHGDKTREEVGRLYKRWIEQTRGDEDIGEPEYSVAVAPEVADQKAFKEDPGKRSVFERFGRFVARKMVQVGKTAAKPF